MRYRYFLFPLLVLLWTTGCAVTSKVMINEQGRQVRCGSFGFGVIGTAVAVGTYMECVKNQEALGYVDLEDFKKTEPPKIEQRPGVTPMKEGRPLWETGYVWTYQLSGTKNGISRQEVTGKDLVKGMTAYVLKADDTTLLLTEELNTIQTQREGAIVSTNTPPLQAYSWPLEVGKTWQAKGELETRTGKINLSTNFEVKGYGVVRVPAGEFEAFYKVSTSDNGARASEVWYAPRVRRHVKIVNYTNEGRLTAELVSYSLGAPPPAPSIAPNPPETTSPPATAPAPPTSTVRQEVAVLPTPAVTSVPPSGPWLGVPLGPPDQQALTRVGIAAGRGAMVLPFTKNPTLPPVDLDPGDVILAIDGVEVEGPGHVISLLAGKTPGTTIQVRAFRSQYQRQGDQPMVVFQSRP
ncbi:MAG: PDZ domain-containing protein [candidate division NC10 bacterium]|nr:PDZ domain-containing protein [candidate division NC10 bacterium]